MSEDKPLPIPPAKMIGKNLRDIPVYLECTGYTVAEWTPLPNGQGKPTAVVISLKMGGRLDGVELGMRIKSRAECNRLIEVLKRHRDGVWPL